MASTPAWAQETAPVPVWAREPAKKAVPAWDTPDKEQPATFQPVKDYTDYVKQHVGQDVKDITNPETVMSQKPASYTMAKTGMPIEADAEGPKPNALATQAQRVVGAASVPYDLAAGGAGHAAISKPLERKTGLPADWTDLALSFTPVAAGAAIGTAGRVAKAIPGGQKVMTAIRESAPVKAIEKLVSPTTVSKESKATEGIIREERGLAERSTEQGKALVQPHYEHLSGMAEPDQISFMNRIETFNKNVPLKDAKAEKAAVELRGIYQTVRNDLEKDPNFDKMGFVEDYFPHMWQDPKAAQQFIQGWVSKSGSGRNVAKRSIPTIEDGLKAGLKLKSTNPAETTLQYVANMYNYKALKGIQSRMKDQGLRVFKARGSQPPGWVELKGPGNRVLYTDKKGVPHENIAYAPEDAARVYNNYYSPGLNGPIAKTLRGVVNGGTMMVLGLSGFHYRLMANEATAAAFSKGLGRAQKGDIAGAGKAALGGTPYLGAGRQWYVGRQAEKQYLTGKGPLDGKIIDYITRAGGRMKGIDRTMSVGGPGSYWGAFRAGTLRASAKADLLDLKGGSVFKAIGKVMDDVNRPLFVKTIPRLKNAVNYESVADWIKLHPNASDQEILKATRDIVDSTDNRFGEMIQDNLFWNKKVKDSMNIMLLSTGWTLGTRREVYGGIKDMATAIMDGKELSPRARYIIALPIAHMLHASVYQYLKTGKAPDQPQDLISPKTGGRSPYGGAPERAAVPSQLKDIIGEQRDPIKEYAGKLAPVWRTVGEMATNSKWNEDPIAYQYIQQAPGPLQAYAKFIIDSFTPIGVKGAIEGPMTDSHIGRVERWAAGSRPAGMQEQNPTAYKNYMKSKEQKREKKGIMHEKADVARHTPRKEKTPVWDSLQP